MKRIIGFRAKSIDGRLEPGEWVYGNFHTIYDTEFGQRTVIQTNGVRCCERNPTFLVDYDTVGEYTGLSDKNGKPIWEGDLVRVGCMLEKHEVRYKDGEFVLHSDCGYVVNLPLREYHYKCVVVGNIYDSEQTENVP